MVPTMEDMTELESIASNLIEIGTHFIAIPRDPLDNGHLHLHTHSLGDELNRYTRKLDDVEHVRIDGETFEFLGISNVLPSEVHFEDRIPLYAVENPSLGLSQIPLEEGIGNLNEFLTGDLDITQSEETASLETLIEELVEGGAVAVSLQKTLFEMDDTTLPLRAHMPPATGHAIAGRYEAVTLDGITYDFFVEPPPEWFGRGSRDESKGVEP